MRLNECVGLWGRYSLKQGYNLKCFKTLIQLYLLCLSLYYLTYCIKEDIKGKIFWRLNEKVPAYVAATAWNRGIPCKFSKHWSNCICFVYFYIFWLTVSKRVSKEIFLDIKFEIFGLWGSYFLKQENTLQNLKITNQIIIFVSWFIVLLNVSKRLSEVRYFEIKWICWPMWQIKIEAGESLEIFQNANTIVFVMFIYLLFELLYQRGYQR